MYKLTLYNVFTYSLNLAAYFFFKLYDFTTYVELRYYIVGSAICLSFTIFVFLFLCVQHESWSYWSYTNNHKSDSIFWGLKVVHSLLFIVNTYSFDENKIKAPILYYVLKNNVANVFLFFIFQKNYRLYYFISLWPNNYLKEQCLWCLK